jgi:glutamate-1-semialdehyde 2,1-aminomutase
MSQKKARKSSRSEAAYSRARRVMPGGVSSPVRAFKAVGGTPVFIREGCGCRVTDLDGNSYIDYVASYGPLIAGHAHEHVVAAVSKAIGRGTSFGAPTEMETLLAEKIASALASVPMVRFVNSGTEAVMSAIRLARAVTGRDKIVKCVGGYHGHSDSLLVQAGSGALTLGTPSSPGIPAALAGLTVLAPYNDLNAAREIFAAHPKELACFLIEPVAGNMGVVPPEPGYLAGLRKLCDESGTLLIFDEVMTGFRVGWNSAQGLYGVSADLTCLGKVIGGGLPVGAYGGPTQFMEKVSPAGNVYQAGTLSGNPLAMSAGLATLEILSEPGAYDILEKRSAALAEGLRAAAEGAGVPLAVNRVGSMLTPFFVRNAGEAVTNFAQATACDTAAYAAFFHSMLEQGIFLPPSQFEAWFVGLAHRERDIQETIEAAQKAMHVVKNPQKQNNAR